MDHVMSFLFHPSDENFTSFNFALFLSISDIVLTHFKPMLYYKLERATGRLFVLAHRVVNSYFWYQSGTM